MKKIFLLVLFLIFSSPVFSADEVITDFESGSVTVLNEELRKISEDIQTTSDSIAPAIAAAAVSAASASEVTAGTVANKYVAPATLVAHEGTAKAWVKFNGTGTIAINDSFNIASITDNGTGDYTINFTTPFASADYAAVFSGQASVQGRYFVMPKTSASFLAGSMNIVVVTSVNDPADIEAICAVFYGNQ